MGIRLKLLSRWFSRRVPRDRVSKQPQISRSELWPKVHDVLVHQLKCPAASVTPNADFVEDLGIDSLNSIELVMALEETFGFEIKDEEVEGFKKVSDLLIYLEEKTRNRK